MIYKFSHIKITDSIKEYLLCILQILIIGAALLEENILGLHLLVEKYGLNIGNEYSMVILQIMATMATLRMRDTQADKD
jgi:hypothetical protein